MPLGKRKRNFLFRIGWRTLLRDPAKLFGIPIPRTIIKTPKVKGRRLALKPKQNLKEDVREHLARKKIMTMISYAHPQRFTMRLSKRYPKIKGRRTELYYDRPSLEDLIERRRNRRVAEFLKQHKMSIDEASEKALDVYDEIEKMEHDFSDRISELSLDLNASQVMVGKIDANGKFELIVIDM